MRHTQKADKVFFVEDVLSLKDFEAVADEFNPLHNHWSFTKSEQKGQAPAFGHLAESRGGLSLGECQKFIEIGVKLTLATQKILGRRARLVRINTNIQFPGQESNFHVDSSPEMRWWTFVLFANMGWDAEWGGEIIINTKGRDYLGLPFLPNCGVLFDGSLPHKGSAPNCLCMTHRQSVAFSFEFEAPEGAALEI